MWDWRHIIFSVIAFVAWPSTILWCRKTFELNRQQTRWHVSIGCITVFLAQRSHIIQARSLLEEHLVGRGNVVVLMCSQTLCNIVGRKAQFLEFLEDGFVDIHFLFKFARWASFGQVEPLMVSEPNDVKTLLWFRCEHAPYDIASTSTQEIGQREISGNDFPAKGCSTLVFKREVAAKHCEEDDATTPYVTKRRNIPFSSKHLWRSVAQRPACCFQHFPILVRVAQTKVRYFNVT